MESIKVRKLVKAAAATVYIPPNELEAANGPTPLSLRESLICDAVAVRISIRYFRLIKAPLTDNTDSSLRDTPHTMYFGA